MAALGEGSKGRKRVVVGVDGSHQSMAALRWAARIAPALDADIEAVTTWHYPAFYGVAPVADWRPDLDAEKISELTLDKTFGSDRPARLSSSVHEGLAPQVLVEMSASADMLIVGSRGHGGFTGLLLGSVSSACAEHAQCPVLVVHGDTG
jgi:nucleotide-binding universal stress UspA family protein